MQGRKSLSSNFTIAPNGLMAQQQFVLRLTDGWSKGKAEEHLEHLCTMWTYRHYNNDLGTAQTDWSYHLLQV